MASCPAFVEGPFEKGSRIMCGVCEADGRGGERGACEHGRGSTIEAFPSVSFAC